jgi:hypothetical protein
VFIKRDLVCAVEIFCDAMTHTIYERNIVLQVVDSDVVKPPFIELVKGALRVIHCLVDVDEIRRAIFIE